MEAGFNYWFFFNTLLIPTSVAGRLERLSPTLAGAASRALGESWRLLQQPNLTGIENKGGVLALGAGSGRVYSKGWGGVQQVGLVQMKGTVGGWGEAVKGAAGRGLSTGGGSLKEEPAPESPVPDMAGAAVSTVWPGRPLRNNRGLRKGRRGPCKGQLGIAQQETPQWDKDMAAGVPCPQSHTVPGHDVLA